MIDTISNNLANVNTVGYKANRADFADLLYQNQQHAITPASEETLVPVGVQIGHGVRLAATAKEHTQGPLQQTGVATDLAIVGDGFLRVEQFDGSFGYTRAGSLSFDANGQLVTPQGYRLLPEVILPPGSVRESFAISSSGEVSVRIADESEPVAIGQIQLYRFVNPAGLDALGENIFNETPASGVAIGGQPLTNGNGRIEHRFIERANVEAATELVNLIVAQRAYELNSRAVQTSDTLLGIANSIKR